MYEKMTAAFAAMRNELKNFGVRLDKFEALPAPAPGKDGEPGRDGRDAPTLEEVVEAVMAQIPVPEDGVSPDKQEIIEEVLAKIPPPAKGEPGRDGRDSIVNVQDVAAIVFAKMPKPEPGKDGRNGRDAPDLGSIVKTVKSQIPEPKRGLKGDKGEPGSSITSVKLKDNELFVAIDGRQKSVGRIIIPESQAPSAAAGGAGSSRRKADPDAAKWRGNWQQQQYARNDMVNDAGYLMIANKITTDRAAPQPDGASRFSLPDNPTWANDTSTDISYSGVELTAAITGVVTAFRVWVPEVGPDVSNTFYLSDVSDPDNPVVLFNAELTNAPAGEWIGLSLPPLTVVAGTSLRAVLVTQKFASNDSWNYFWDLQDEAGGVPALGTYTRNAAYTELRINKQDESGADRSADLALLKVGDLLDAVEDGSLTRTNDYQINSVSDEGAYYLFGVTRLDNGSVVRTGRKVSLTATIREGILPAPFVRLDNYWTDNPPDGLSNINGFQTNTFPPQAGDRSDDAYGIDLSAYALISSPDWDLMSASNAAATGGAMPENAALEVLGEFMTTVTQTPTGLGDAGKIRVNFGAGGNTVGDEFTVDPDGTINCNSNGIQYDFDITVRAQRTGGGGVSELVGRFMYAPDGVEANAIQISNSVTIRIDDANTVWREQFEVRFSPTVGSKLWFEFARNPGSANSGEIGTFQPTGDLAGWNQSDSASLTIGKLVVQ